MSSTLDRPDGDWLPRHSRLEPDLRSLLPTDTAREFDEEDTLRFFEELREGGGEMEIGLSLGWTPAMVKRFVNDPARKELIDAIREAQWESLERSFIRHAHAGNSTAMKLVAFNKMRHRGWADRRDVHVETQSQLEIVHSVRDALDEKARQLVGRGGVDGVQALQLLAGLTPDEPDDDDDGILDAEVVDAADLHA